MPSIHLDSRVSKWMLIYVSFRSRWMSLLETRHLLLSSGHVGEDFRKRMEEIWSLFSMAYEGGSREAGHGQSGASAQLTPPSGTIHPLIYLIALVYGLITRPCLLPFAQPASKEVLEYR